MEIDLVHFCQRHFQRGKCFQAFGDLFVRQIARQLLRQPHLGPHLGHLLHFARPRAKGKAFQQIRRGLLFAQPFLRIGQLQLAGISRPSEQSTAAQHSQYNANHHSKPPYEMFPKGNGPC